MKKRLFMFELNNGQVAKWMLSALCAGILSGCIASLEPGDPLIPVGDETPGPGLFSGEDGVFAIKGGNKVAAANSEKSAIDRLKDEDLQAAPEILDEKIQQLELQQEELEQLKREVNKKLKTN